MEKLVVALVIKHEVTKVAAHVWILKPTSENWLGARIRIGPISGDSHNAFGSQNVFAMRMA